MLKVNVRNCFSLTKPEYITLTVGATHNKHGINYSAILMNGHKNLKYVLNKATSPDYTLSTPAPDS